MPTHTTPGAPTDPVSRTTTGRPSPGSTARPASECRPTVATIDVEACARNLARIRRHAPHRDVWAVVKADAYGHGAVRVARRLAAEAVAGFVVATATEGVELRRAGIAQPILISAGVAIGPGHGAAIDPFRVAVEYRLTVTVWSRDALVRLASAAREAGIGPVPVQLKIDTGMARLGVQPDAAVARAREIDEEPALSLEGVYSHLSTGDSFEEDAAGFEHVRRQTRRFEAACAALESAGLLPGHRHLANSAATMHHSRTWEPDLYTGVRPGIALYGASLTKGRDTVDLEPAMTLTTEIADIRAVPEGEPVGYGMTFVPRRPSRLAVLPVGYHDGLPPAIGGRRSGGGHGGGIGRVLVRGRRAPVVGSVGMDLTLADVTDISAAGPGDTVWLLGGPADVRVERSRDATAPSEASEATRGAIRVEEVAAWAGTIPHEVLCRIGTRVPRVEAAASDATAPGSMGGKREVGR